MSANYVEKMFGSLKEFEIKFGLERIKKVLEELDDPQENIRTVHVAGTNGKGSVCEALSSLLKAAGYKVGLYASPHINRVNERFKLGGKEISEKDMERYVEKARGAALRVGEELTYFELLTVVNFLYFAEKKVDYLMLEAGLGGRLDATNVILRPELVIITSISLDHTNYLGKTISSVAGEKGAVIKRDVRVITGKLPEEALNVLEVCAWEKKSRIFRLGDDFDIKYKLLSGSKCVVSCDYRGISGSIKGFNIKTANLALPDNVAIAFAAFELLTGKMVTKKLAGAVECFAHKGRICSVTVKKNSISFDAVMDGAHNPGAVWNLVKSLRTFFPKKKKVFILNFMKDKDYRENLKILCPEASVVMVKRIHCDRALDPAVAAKFIKANYKHVEVKVIDKFKCLSENDSGSGRLAVFCGSFYLLGEIEKELKDEGYKVSGC